MPRKHNNLITNIYKFEPECLSKRRLKGKAPIILFVGGRDTGKTVLLLDILYHLRNTPKFVCMSSTEGPNPTYKKHIHDLFIHKELDTDLIQKMMDTQGKIPDLKNKPENGLGLIIEDLAFEKSKIRSSKILEKLFVAGRHYLITLMMTLQYTKMIPPSFRGNVDYVFVTIEPNKILQKQLYEHFFGVFDNFKQFQKTLNKCTQNHGCLVWAKNTKSTKIEDSVFWYKAKLNREFQIGTPRQWIKWDKLYNPDYNENSTESEENDYENEDFIRMLQ